jgi:hypothetical protein
LITDRSFAAMQHSNLLLQQHSNLLLQQHSNASLGLPVTAQCAAYSTERALPLERLLGAGTTAVHQRTCGSSHLHQRHPHVSGPPLPSQRACHLQENSQPVHTAAVPLRGSL